MIPQYKERLKPFGFDIMETIITGQLHSYRQT
jgi:hypothetical protein